MSSPPACPDGSRRVIVETDQPPGCPTCGVVTSRRKERRFRRIRDIPVAGPVEVLWSKYRWYCEEPACERLSFFESTAQVPRRVRSTGRLRDQLDGVIRSGRAVSETAAAFAVSWWIVRAALNEACFLTLPDANEAVTETRQNLSQQVKGRRGSAVDKAWAHQMLLLRTGSLQDAATAKKVLEELVKAAARPEANRLRRTVCRWWKEIEVLIITGATTGKVEANNTAIKTIKRTARGYRNPANYKSVILLTSAARTAA